jgi:2,4-dichlorophenol 6-monooxygenase
MALNWVNAIAARVFPRPSRFRNPTRDADLYFQPSTAPGSHLPHVWLQRRGEQISSLDLANYGGFTLIIGIGGAAWARAAKTLTAELGVDIKPATVGLRQELDDPLGEWMKVREISDRGCLLVRPDRFIAWRSAGLPHNPVQELRSAILSALGRRG